MRGGNKRPAIGDRATIEPLLNQQKPLPGGRRGDTEGSAQHLPSLDFA